MYSIDAWTRSAIELNAVVSSPISRELDGGSTRVSRWPSDSSRAAPVRRRIGFESRSAIRIEATTATMSAITPASPITLMIVSTVCAR